MTAALGETYQYYMTCVTADGTESARSNVETVEAVLDTVKVPAAPTNVVCVDPTSSTTGVQNTITISWNAASVADADQGKRARPLASSIPHYPIPEFCVV